MKHLLLTTIAALVLVVCGESQQSTSTKEAKPVEPFVEAELPDSLPGKSTDISIWDAARTGNILSVNQLLKTGPGGNAASEVGWTPFHWSAWMGHKEVSKLLIEKGADVNTKTDDGHTPLDFAFTTQSLLRKHGGKTAEELKAAGN